MSFTLMMVYCCCISVQEKNVNEMLIKSSINAQTFKRTSVASVRKNYATILNPKKSTDNQSRLPHYILYLSAMTE